MANLLEGPVYTKPPVWRGHEVPEVLLSGHHGRIARWRRDEALRRTLDRRPELVARLDRDGLDKHDRRVIEEFEERLEERRSAAASRPGFPPAFRAVPEDMAD
jgi:tRNA (guanine37-N1)-methyltransferase